ncbi:MAG: fibronectin type III domain-containing protein [Patescibacteria group bacterium]|jgi:hypothetical protein
MLRIKKLEFIGITAIALIAGFMFAGPVLATESNIVVIFNPNPLFGAVNFLPGQAVTAHIEIKNKSGVSKPLAIEAINVNDPNHFGNALNLEIKEGSQTILNKSLTEFFNQGETFLSNLANNASTTYDLIVTFNSSAGNDYKNKILNNFDILVGFQGEQTPVTPPGQGGGGGAGGGSGGGGSVPAGLTIFNEAEINVMTVTATLTWQTNYLSTSRVIWGAENEAHTFDFSSPPNYGYAHSTIDDLTKVTFHSVTLTGLTPGTTYYYRVISHASPDTVSRSLTFKTTGESAGLPVPPAEETLPPAETPPISGNPTAPTNPAGTVAGVGFQEEITPTSTVVTGKEQPTEEEGKVLAETTEEEPAATPKNCINYIWLLLVLNLVTAAIIALKGKNGNKLVKYSGLVPALIAIVSVIIWYPQCWLVTWLAIVLVLAVVYLIILFTSPNTLLGKK